MINGMPLVKIKLFCLFFWVSYAKTDFTHHFVCIAFATDHIEFCRDNKKVWKRNIDEIYDFELNPIMQYRNYTLTEVHLLVPQWQCSLQIRAY